MAECGRRATPTPGENRDAILTRTQRAGLEALHSLRHQLHNTLLVWEGKVCTRARCFAIYHAAALEARTQLLLNVHKQRC